MPDPRAERLATHYLRSDDLKYGWLLKVKKGWLATLDAPYPVEKRFDALFEFLLNLKDQIEFKQFGIQLRFYGQDLDDVFAALAKTRGVLEKKREEYTDLDWMVHKAGRALRDAKIQVEEETGRTTRDLIRELDVEGFYAKFPQLQPLRAAEQVALTARDRATYELPKFLAPATKAFEAVMSLLYTDAKALAEYQERGGELDDMTVDKVFDLYGMKIVTVSRTVDRPDMRAYIKIFDQAHGLLKRKGFGVVWHGVIFLDNKHEEFSEADKKWRAEWGYDTSAAAGHYVAGKDQIYVTQAPKPQVVATVVHELGHRYWYKVMKPGQRQRFNDLVRTKASLHQRDYEQGPHKPGWRSMSFDLQAKRAALDKLLGELARAVEGDHKAGRIWAEAEDLAATWEARLRDFLPKVPGLSVREAEEAISVVLSSIDGLSLLSEAEAVEGWEAWQRAFLHADLPQARQTLSDYLDVASKIVSKPVAPLTDYAESNIEEAFAEVFEAYVMGEDMNRDQLESFRSVLSSARPLVPPPHRLALRLAVRYLETCTS